VVSFSSSSSYQHIISICLDEADDALFASASRAAVENRRFLLLLQPPLLALLDC
jgi:hypothetical protein